MTYKELMTDSLTKLLKEGETLKYPIFGVLYQGNEQYSGYFGFAGEDLLIALLSGKTVSYTMRVPLNIKSLKVKQSLVFRQYTIDIGFTEGAPCRILASPKVMTIDSQGENMPLFLQYLHSKAPMKQTPELKKIEGKKIRWQYFNTFIYVMLSFLPMVFILVVSSGLKRGEFGSGDVWKILLTSCGIFLVFLIPFIVLSILNRCIFGKTVCVVHDDGLYLENDFIPWSSISEMVYCPRLLTGVQTNYTYLTVCVKTSEGNEYATDILHFPHYGLKMLQKKNPNIKIKTEKQGIVTGLLCALIPTAIAVIFALV